MQLALMTEPQLGGSYDQLASAARKAEKAGLVTFARSDHFYWTGDRPAAATEAFATLGGLARETERIRLAVLVSPITFRHPSVIAKSAATLDQMSSGRFDLGVGAGWMEAEHEGFGIPFPEPRERFVRLQESLEYLRASFTGGSYSGRHYRIDANALPRPTGLRLIVGGNGPEKTPALAGRFADEYNQTIDVDRVLIPKITRMREAAANAGRDPASIVVSVMGPAVVARDATQLEDLLACGAQVRNLDVSDLRQRWTTRGVPFGTVDKVQSQLGRLAEIGVSKYYLQWLHLDDVEGLGEFVDLVQGLGPGLKKPVHP